LDFLTAMQISASGLTAQRTRMALISNNVANIHSSRTPQGGPYNRKQAVFAAIPVAGAGTLSFDQTLQEVKVIGIVDDIRESKRVYDPGHPDADPQGFVFMPNVNLIEEMVDLMLASRAYEANIIAINAAKNMAQKALEI
jgi:flagellar basal-body rod protein FlgC